MTETPAGIAAPEVTAWFGEHVKGTVPPLGFHQIAGGRSNLTYRVDDAAGHSWVLRRPPLGNVLATAHDMSREHRIIEALAPTDVPVPQAIGLCEDTDVNGAPFYVMEYVEGAVLRNRTEAEPFPVTARRRAAEGIADVLARLHHVDPDEVGLGELGRKEGYLERQLRRWSRQWADSKTRELPAVEEVHAELSARIPEQGPAAIVHGDYRLDNCLLGPDGSIRAVLDWELCTLGDPLADVGLLLVYWTEPDDVQAALGDSATTLEGFGSRDQLVRRYAETRARLAGADADMQWAQALEQIDYYVAFGYWKLACILEGVYARYRAGAMGEADGFEIFARQVEFLAEAARAKLDQPTAT